jgi:type II restriction enzyme
LNIKQSEKYAITSNIFDKFPELFSNNNNSSNFIKVYGRSKNSSQRIYKEIKKEYIADHANKEYWKVFVAKSNGTGKYGEALSPAEVASPGTVCTQTFISFGKFKSKEEAISLKKYLSTKFLRSLLDIKKVTPDNARKDVWLFVPLQDFTDHSDIDWSKSIPEIDQQLYRKYGLNDEEIDFIETHVKEMK